MNNFEKTLEGFYLGIPERRGVALVDEIKSGDVMNIDNSSITDSSGVYRQIQIAITDPTTAPTAGSNKGEIRIPFAQCTLTTAYATLTTAGSGVTQCSLKNSSGQDIMLGYLQITAGSTISPSGTVDQAKQTFVRNDPIRVTTNTVSSSSRGLIITMYFIVDVF